jgi:hypothetical protein
MKNYKLSLCFLFTFWLNCQKSQEPNVNSGFDASQNMAVDKTGLIVILHKVNGTQLGPRTMCGYSEYYHGAFNFHQFHM